MNSGKGRNTKEIKHILEKLPHLTSYEEQTLLADLVLIRQYFCEINSNCSKTKSFIASKISLIEKVERIIKDRLYYDLSQREVIAELYKPLFENDTGYESTNFTLNGLLVKDLKEIKESHPLGSNYSLEDFIELLLIEKTIEYSRSSKNKEESILRRILPFWISN